MGVPSKSAVKARLRELLSRLEQYERVKTIVLPILAIIVLPYYEPWDPPVELRGRVVGLYQWPSKVEASPANRYPSSPLKFPTQASGPEKRFGQISLSVKDLGRSG